MPFITPMGLYKFLQTPIGLKNAPATFQHLMELCLRYLNQECLLICLDDIIIFLDTFKEYLQRVEHELGRLEDPGLKLKPHKCNLFWESMEYLGH